MSKGTSQKKIEHNQKTKCYHIYSGTGVRCTNNAVHGSKCALHSNANLESTRGVKLGQFTMQKR